MSFRTVVLFMVVWYLHAIWFPVTIGFLSMRHIAKVSVVVDLYEGCSISPEKKIEK